MKETKNTGIQYITSDSPDYPRRLRHHGAMPRELYYLGSLPKDEQPTIGIVGARMCSPYGRAQAYSYARFYSSFGIQVISGMAIGIDQEAHRGAMDAGTPTFAVLGSGVDVCYPRTNAVLYERLQKRGGILSEFPPGSPASAWHFPVRNRIISALSDVLLVVEARERSGSLITVDHALEQGKSVYALPGMVSEELSRGCHKLIEQGAGIAYSPEILLKEWGISCENPAQNRKKMNLGLARELDLVYSCLDLRPKNLEILIKETGFPAEKLMNFLIELELSGLIREIGKNFYVRIQK
ncbi:MAG: DNA-processing protein DprA [Eubacteriales bacterium]|nr:DNA-processing protein DprA [Eubacteriales bacterium]